jgi:hypothetical protein
MFTLRAQVFGNPHTVSVDDDGLGVTITTPTGTRRVRNVESAVRTARQDLTEFLMPAQRHDAPWGLCVSVAGVSAYYGDVRFCGGGGRGNPLPQNELVVRIRRRWHDNQGPLAALENALEIVQAYVGRSSLRRAA